MANFEQLFNFKGIDTFVKKTEFLNKKLENTVGLFKDINTEGGIFGKIGSNISTVGKLMKGLGGDVGTVGKMVNIFGGAFQASIQNGSTALSAFKLSIGAVNTALVGMGTTASAVFTAIGVSLGAVLFPIAIVIGVIVGAVVLLKKAWANNFGGIQTQTSKFVGVLKDVFGQISVGVNKVMQVFSPFAKIIVTKMFTPLIGVFKFISGFLKGFGSALAPVGKVIKDVGNLLNKVMGTTEKSTFALKAFAAVGKTLGFIFGSLLKIVLLPLIGALKIIEASLTAIGKVKGFFGNIFGGDDDGGSSGGKKSKTLSSQEALANRQFNTKNNNNNVTINTSREISPEGAPQIADVIAANLQTTGGMS